MKPAGNIGHGGKKALAHSRAVQVMAHGFGEKGLLVAKGHCPWTWGISRLWAMERPDPGGENITRMAGDRDRTMECRKRRLNNKTAKKKTEWQIREQQMQTQQCVRHAASSTLAKKV
jgi:hypothetical protein